LSEPLRDLPDHNLKPFRANWGDSNHFPKELPRLLIKGMLPKLKHTYFRNVFPVQTKWVYHFHAKSVCAITDFLEPRWSLVIVPTAKDERHCHEHVNPDKRSSDV